MSININIEPTPNPNALKFFSEHPVLNEGRVTISRIEDCIQPLEISLFELDGVTQVHYFERVITVTKKEDAPWDNLLDKVKLTIADKIAAHSPEADYSFLQKDGPKETDELKKINDVLDVQIRPALQGDGGDLELVSYENKILTVNFQGACGGCPSSTMGTLQAIEHTLKEQVDSEITVVPVN